MSCIILIFCWNSTKLIVIFKHYSFKWFSLVCILIFIYHQIHFYQLVMGILFGANLFKLDLSASNLILVSFFSRYFTTHFQSTNKRGDLYLVLCFLEIWQFNIRVILIAPVRLENGYGIKSIKTRNTWQYTINRDVLSKCLMLCRKWSAYHMNALGMLVNVIQEIPRKKRNKLQSKNGAGKWLNPNHTKISSK